MKSLSFFLFFLVLPVYASGVNKCLKNELFTSIDEVSEIHLLNKALSQDERNMYHVGLLLQDESGKKTFVYGDVINSHDALLLKGVTRNKGKELKILWAGEFESSQGKILRVNETAGIYERHPDLLNGELRPGNQIKHIESFFKTKKSKTSELTSDTKYLKYNDEAKHLEKSLEELAIIRHDFRAPVNNLFGLRSVIKILEPSEVDEIADILSKVVESIDMIFYEAKKNLSRVKVYLPKELQTNLISLRRKAQKGKLSAEELKFYDEVIEQFNVFINGGGVGSLSP